MMSDGPLAWLESHQALLFWLAGFSVLMLIASMLILPLLVALLPEDYFCSPRRHESRLAHLHPLVYYAARILKNLLGWLLIVAGCIMLFLPGQGLLTLLMGLLLSDFPGKFRLERQLARKPRILAAINWLRQRANRPPLVAPPPAD